MIRASRNWDVMVAASQAERARAVAFDIAARLKDRDTLKRAAIASVEQTAIPDLMQWRQYSIPQGSAGLAVMFGHLDACFPSEGWDAEAHWHLETAARSLEHNGSLGIALFGELSGVAFAADFLSKQGRRYQGLLSTIDEVLLPQVEHQVENLNAATGGVVNHHYDTITGISGAGVYLLGRASVSAPRRTLESVLSCLVRLTKEEEGGPRWRTPPHLVYDERLAKEYPSGFLNCGLSHGIPGPLALMSSALTAGIGVPNLETAIQSAADWLVGHRLDDMWGINWPVAFPLSNERGGIDEKTLQTGRAGWCYGSPGVSRALLLAGHALDNQTLVQFATDAMYAVLARPTEQRQLYSAAFCHGIAGLLQIVLRFLHDTGLPAFSVAANQLVDDLLSAYEPDSILGYRSVEYTGKKIDNPGLLDGAPGVCLTLLSAAAPTEPTWDRLFLLSR